MNEIIDKIVGNNLVFGGILIFLGVILLILIVSIVRSAKKSRKIPIYEEDLEDTELEKIKDENIIDKPEVKKKQKKKVEKKKEIVEEDDEEDINLEVILEEEEIAPEEEQEDLPTSSAVEEVIADEKEIVEEKSKEPVVEQETIYSDGEAEEIIDEGYSEERIAELENIDEEEIKERIDKEHEEVIEETMEEIDNEEMVDILQNLKEAREVKPEDVVRQFEQEQEAQSIISYQELVDVVKNRDKDFEDELESKPLATVSDFLPEVPKEENKDSDMAKLIEELGQPKEPVEIEELEKNIEIPPSLDEEDDDIAAAKAMVREALKKEIPSDGKFKKTELISPVFGRITEEPEDSYPTVKKFTHEDEVEAIEEIELPEVKKDDTIETEATDIESFEDISEELEEEENPKVLFEEIPNEEKLEKTSDLGMGDISKNEEFLKALKDFRDSL